MRNEAHLRFLLLAERDATRIQLPWDVVIVISIVVPMHLGSPCTTRHGKMIAKQLKLSPKAALPKPSIDQQVKEALSRS